jgi:hypothetical protein
MALYVCLTRDDFDCYHRGANDPLSVPMKLVMAQALLACLLIIAFFALELR